MMTARLSYLSIAFGKLSALLIFALLLISVSVVFMRYCLGIGSIALQEAMTYCHGAAFLLAMAYTLHCDEHVRVDIFYQRFNPRQRAWVDALGSLLLTLPFCGFLLFGSAHFFYKALSIQEASADAGGLAFVYLFKGILPLAMLLLCIQALQQFYCAAKTIVLVSKPSASHKHEAA